MFIINFASFLDEVINKLLKNCLITVNTLTVREVESVKLDAKIKRS
jgi:hypothetical protein